MADINGSSDDLKSLQDGVPPETRLSNAESTQNRVQRLMQNDMPRSQKRARVDGIVDGNAPYSSAKLREQNRADAANFNDGTGRAFLEGAVGAFYDLSSEAPGRFQIATSHGNEDNKVEWSRVLSKRADLMMARDKSWDSKEQTSQNETVLHGTGPYYFENGHTVLPKSIPTGNLLVPDLAPSNIEEWEEAAILNEYTPPQLYDFIRNPEAATKMGWDVEYTRLVIQNAVDQKQRDSLRQWEWYQNELKTNSFNYSESIHICRLAHVFCKEFDGRITHVIVQRNDSGGLGTKYLYKRIGRYDNWFQVVHPMYFDAGRAGLHHSVTGLGVKMYGLISYKNRLYLNLLDKSFAPKILFKPTTSEAATKFQLARFGDWGLLPPGTEAVQTPIQGFLTDGLAIYRTTDDMLRSNLSQYQRPVEPDRPGNPETALEIKMKASQAGALSNTTFNRYYKQLDLLYSEIVRRLCNLNSTDPRAIEFQDKCMAEGVPKECFGRIESVSAVRVIGQGSPFMRQQVIQGLLPMIQRLPENGQMNLIDDMIAANAGQTAVNRYNPKSKNSLMNADQKERATVQVALAKIGVPPVSSPSQNPIIFAGTFIQAASQAIQSVQQGADPKEVIQFLEIIGPSIHAQLQRISGDPTRVQAHDVLEEQALKIGKLTDQLKAMVQQQMEQQKGQQQKTAQVLNDLQLAQLETKSKIEDRNLKTAAALQDKQVKSQHGMALKTASTKQQLAIQDAKAASEISLQHAKAQAEQNEPEPATAGT